MADLKPKLSGGNYLKSSNEELELELLKVRQVVRDQLSREGLTAWDGNLQWINTRDLFQDCSKRCRNMIRLSVDGGYLERLMSGLLKSADRENLSDEIAEELIAEYGFDQMLCHRVISELFEEVRAVFTDSMRGKVICNRMKQMRSILAEEYGIDYAEAKCSFEEPCLGTCPYTEGKTEELLKELAIRGKNSVRGLQKQAVKAGEENGFHAIRSEQSELERDKQDILGEESLGQDAQNQEDRATMNSDLGKVKLVVKNKLDRGL